MTFEVERDAGAGQRKTLALTVTPDDTPPRTEFATPRPTSRSMSRGWVSAIR